MQKQMAGETSTLTRIHAFPLPTDVLIFRQKKLFSPHTQPRSFKIRKP